MRIGALPTGMNDQTEARATIRPGDIEQDAALCNARARGRETECRHQHSTGDEDGQQYRPGDLGPKRRETATIPTKDAGDGVLRVAAAISALFANDFGARGQTRVHDESWSERARAAQPACAAPMGVNVQPGGSGARASGVRVCVASQVSTDKAPPAQLSAHPAALARKHDGALTRDISADKKSAPCKSTKRLCLSQSATPAIITAKCRAKTPDARVRTSGSSPLPPATRRGDQEVLCRVLCVCCAACVVCVCVCVCVCE